MLTRVARNSLYREKTLWRSDKKGSVSLLRCLLCLYFSLLLFLFLSSAPPCPCKGGRQCRGATQRERKKRERQEKRRAADCDWYRQGDQGQMIQMRSSQKASSTVRELLEIQYLLSSARISRIMLPAIIPCSSDAHDPAETYQPKEPSRPEAKNDCHAWVLDLDSTLPDLLIKLSFQRWLTATRSIHRLT